MPLFTLPDGRRLHTTEAGEGEPTVVFESGMGASGNCWAAVQAEVGATTRTVAYDRANLGRSDPDTAPRTLQRIVEDLLALIDHLDAKQLILVGHSWGGPIVRLAAAERPERVAGLVLVDPTDETCDIYFDARAMKVQQRAIRVMPLLARTGLLRLGIKRAARKLPEPGRGDMARLDGSAATARASATEYASIDAGLHDLLAAPPELGTVPVTIISGTKAGGIGKTKRASLTAAHEASAARLPDGRQVLAQHSGHLVPLSEPELVAKEIQSVVEGLRQSAV